MVWTWRYESQTGEAVEPAEAPEAEAFSTQSDAETWIGESWRQLLDGGVQQVTLLDDDRSVYTMGLSPQG